jgi:hypothetical protein
MFRWSKSGKNPSPAAAGGEVAVQKVDRIEVRNVLTRPPGPPTQGGTDGDAFRRKVEEFRQRKKGFHS